MLPEYFGTDASALPEGQSRPPVQVGELRQNNQSFSAALLPRNLVPWDHSVTCRLRALSSNFTGND